MNTTVSPIHSEHSSARIPLDKSGPLESALGWVSKKMYGKVLDPFRAAFHHRPILFSSLGLELAAMRWKKLPQNLQALAVMTVAQEIGCSWCMDFGFWENHHRGIETAKLRDVAHWRTSSAYTDLERAVMEYSAAATATPPTVTDEMVARLREHLTDAQVVELVGLVSLENFRSRTNAGLGLTSQGFKAECQVPIRDVS